MIKFLFKGLIRDRSRSLLPIIVISIGVLLTVLLSGYMKGAFSDVIDQNANFDTGHVKIMSKAYAENKDQIPNDLALLEVDYLINNLKSDYKNIDWVKRIKFGGLIDVPDTNGETKTQGPAVGMALELFSGNGSEIKRLKIEKALIEGKIPEKEGEVIIGLDFAKKLQLKLGDKITYFGTTMEGSMTFKTFEMVGIIRFGTPAMDKGTIIIDVADAQKMLDMDDGAGEILGFLDGGLYNNKKVNQIKKEFNNKHRIAEDEFAPIMLTLKDQNNLASLIDFAEGMTNILIFIFIIAMSIVLWNTGLLGGLRRYQEFGIRLALGESKGKIYRSLVLEAILIGIIGSIIGTSIGMGLTYYMQVVGLDISDAIKNSSMIMPSVIRSKITPDLFYIGFIPGVLAMVLGNMLAGIGIYKRSTANLFKELEV